MKKQRKHYTPEELTSYGGICWMTTGLQPTVHRWQKEFFENGADAFQPKRSKSH
jgi:hypothetical protein